MSCYYDNDLVKVTSTNTPDFLSSFGKKEAKPVTFISRYSTILSKYVLLGKQLFNPVAVGNLVGTGKQPVNQDSWCYFTQKKPPPRVRTVFTQ